MASQTSKNFYQTMKNTVTFGHFLTIMSIFVLPAIGWVITAEQRFQQTLKNEQEIMKVKQEIKEERSAREQVEKDILLLNTKILEKLHTIELKLENKQNRK